MKIFDEAVVESATGPMTDDELAGYRAIAEAGAKHPNFGGPAPRAWLRMLDEIDRLRALGPVAPEIAPTRVIDQLVRAIEDMSKLDGPEDQAHLLDNAGDGLASALGYLLTWCRRVERSDGTV